MDTSQEKEASEAASLVEEVADATRSGSALMKMSRSIPIRKYGSAFSKAGLATLIINKGTASQLLVLEAKHLSSVALTKVIKWTTLSIAGLGTHDAVSGATQITQIAPSAGSSTVPAKAGELLNLVYQITGAPHRARSWAVIGELPEGLTHLNSTNSNTDGITGIPTQPGNYRISVRAYKNSNNSGYNYTKNFTIEVAPGAQPPSISTQPMSLITTSVSEEILKVIASGNGLEYQWYKGNSGNTSKPILGANSDSLKIGSLNEDTNYWVRVSNDSGFIDSDTAKLRVIDNYGAWASETFRAANIVPEMTEPDADADNDGLTNGMEYVLGNSPIEQSIDAETTLKLQNSMIEFSFQTEPATGKGYIGLERVYSLEKSDDLSKGSWMPVEEYQNIIGEGQKITISESATHGSKYYRLTVKLREKS